MPNKDDDKDELPIKCNEATINNTACSNEEDDIVFQFKIIISIVFIILILFLAFFVYNLIKCYLPKWRKEKERKVEIADVYENQPTI